MIKTFLEIFFLYILYKVIFDFIIPLYSASKQVKQKMNDIHETMQQKQKSETNDFNNKQNNKPKVNTNDYIDYEEVK